MRHPEAVAPLRNTVPMPAAWRRSSVVAQHWRQNPAFVPRSYQPSRPAPSVPEFVQARPQRRGVALKGRIFSLCRQSSAGPPPVRSIKVVLL